MAIQKKNTKKKASKENILKKKEIAQNSLEKIRTEK